MSDIDGNVYNKFLVSVMHGDRGAEMAHTAILFLNQTKKPVHFTVIISRVC